MCKRENVDLEADFKRLQDNVDKKGFTLEVIKKLLYGLEIKSESLSRRELEELKEVLI